MVDALFDRNASTDDQSSVSEFPARTVLRTFGTRTPDPRVEYVVSKLAYWMDVTSPMGAGARQPLLRAKVLEAMRGRIDATNIRDLIALLVQLGLAEQFFGLTRSWVDADGALRQFLFDNGLGMDEIRLYAAWTVLDVGAFVAGFAYGVGESAASIVVGLVDVARLAVKVAETYLRTELLLITDPQAGLRSIYDQALVVIHVFHKLIELLDPALLPGRLRSVWTEWIDKFNGYLENMDASQAGRMLGRLAGDLFQILTASIALWHLLRASARLALQYAPLAIASVRSAATEAGAVLSRLVDLLVAIGKRTVDGLPRVGVTAFRDIVPRTPLRKMLQDGCPFLALPDISLTLVPEAAYAEAFGGTQMESDFGILVTERGRPAVMAATSEKLTAVVGSVEEPGSLAGAATAERPPPGGRSPTIPWVATREEHQQAMEALDETLSRIDSLFRDPEAAGAQRTVSQLTIQAALDDLAEQRLDVALKAGLRQDAEETFKQFAGSAKWTATNQAGRFGKAVHPRRAARVGAEVTAIAPGLLAYPEMPLREVVASLRAARPDVRAALAKGSQILDERVAAILTRHPEALDILAVARAPEARSEAAIGQYLKRYGWSERTTAGNLQSDLLLIDTDARRVVNVDWTAATNAERFEKIRNQVIQDLRGEFSGDWEGLAEAYQRAGKDEIPANVKRELDWLTRHALRETVIRKIVLDEIFEGWYVTSHELLYNGLRKLEKQAMEAAAVAGQAKP